MSGGFVACRKIVFIISNILLFCCLTSIAIPDVSIPRKALFYHKRQESGATRLLVSLYLMAARVHDFSDKYPAVNKYPGCTGTELAQPVQQANSDRLPTTETPETAASFWPDIQLDLSKGSPREVLDSKELCGIMVYTACYLAETIDPEKNEGVRLGMGALFLVPPLYQVNDEFNYARADLPTILTIFSIKTAIKLMDQDINSHALSVATYVPIVVILWSYHASLPGQTRPCLWLATPKILMSSSLNHLYKGIATRLTQRTGAAMAHAASGTLALGVGITLNRLATDNWLPSLDGFTASLAGKVGKLSGYGVGDLSTKLIEQTESHPVIGGYLKTLVLKRALIIFDVLFPTNSWPYVTASIRRGLIVKTALANIELEILLMTRIIEQMSYYTLNTEFMSLDYQVWNVHSGEPEVSEKGCFYTLVPGFSTELYGFHCTALYEGSFDSDSDLLNSLTNMIRNVFDWYLLEPGPLLRNEYDSPKI